MSRLSIPLLRRRPRTAAEERAEAASLPGLLDRAAHQHVDDSTRTLYKVASLLLDYPTAELREQAPRLRELVDAAAARGGSVAGQAPSARHLQAFLDHLQSTPLDDVQTAYVETFDMRRRCCLHLTYYAYGDTRRRGMALLDMKQAYQACGVDLTDEELPDHLGVLLEFAATVDPGVGRTLLLHHRPGLELLRISLHDRDSVWAHVLDAVSGTLPVLAGDDKDTVARLITAGPPDEEVGMEAYRTGSRPYLPDVVDTHAHPLSASGTGAAAK